MALTRPKYSDIVDSDFKNSCRIVTTTDITLSAGAPSTYDGVSLAANDRILVAGQNTASENGIYYVSVLGTGATGTWLRTFDANDGTRLTSGAQTAITAGSNVGKIYRLVTPDPITIGSTSISWVSGAATPGGSDTQLQYNSGGTIAGASDFKYFVGNGNVVVGSTTTSTSKTTGALVVAGGIGIGTDSYFAGKVLVESNQNTGSPTLAIRNLSSGSSAYAGVKLGNDSNDNGFQIYLGGSGTSDANKSTLLSTYGGLDLSAGPGGIITATAGLNSIQVDPYYGIKMSVLTGNKTEITSNAVISAGTPSSSTTTGALVVVGGVGISGAATIGGTATISGTTKSSGNVVAGSGTASTSTTTGALVVVGGAGVSGALNVGSTVIASGNVVAGSGTTSSSTTTGALVVNGGAGISGATYIGGVADVTGATTLRSTLGVTGVAQFTNSTDNNGATYTSGALQVTGGVGIGGNLYVQGNIYTANVIASTTTILQVSEPLLYLNADNPSTYNYDVGFYSHFVQGRYQHTGMVRDHNDGIWKIFSNVANEPASATVSFTNAVYDAVIAGNLNLANTTVSTSSTTGALTVNGGAGISGNINVGGNISANSNIKLSSISSTSSVTMFYNSVYNSIDFVFA